MLSQVLFTGDVLKVPNIVKLMCRNKSLTGEFATQYSLLSNAPCFLFSLSCRDTANFIKYSRLILFLFFILLIFCEIGL